MNSSQLSAFKAAILAETSATLVTRRTNADYTGIANWYAGNSSVIVWKSSVRKSDVLERISIADLAALTADQRGQLEIYLKGEDVPCDRPRVREAFATIFLGTPTATRLLELWKRAANRAEAISATGATGGDAGTDANPHNLRYEGEPDSALVGAALRS